MNKILEMKFGSHLYGTQTPESDLDFKAIYIPTAREIILGNYRETISQSRSKAACERNTKDDTDMEIFSLDRYLSLLTEGQTVALDMLFAPQEMIVNRTASGGSIMSEIFNNRGKLLTKNVNAFIGYARQQAARYGIKGSRMDALKRVSKFLTLGPMSDNTKLAVWERNIDELVLECASMISLEKTPLVEVVMLKGPKGLMDAPHLRVNGRSIAFHTTVKYAREIVDKMLDSYGQRAHKAHLEGGIDWKALSHAVRVNSEAVELLTTSNITFPRPDAKLLTQIKMGLLPYEQVAELIEQGLADLYVANEKSTLREEPDYEWVNDLIYDAYSTVVKDSSDIRSLGRIV